MLQRQAVERLCVERPKLGAAVQNRGQPVRVGQVDVLPLHKVPIAVGIPGGVEAAKIDGANKWQTLKNVTIPMVMPSITICLFLTLSNSFKLFDQNLALTNGAPMHNTEMLALNIVNSFYGRVGFEGVGQAKAVMFFVIVACIALAQLYYTRNKEVEQ